MEGLRKVFMAEGVLNLVSGALLTFAPEFCMEQQGLPKQNALANANLSQFGTLGMLLGYLGIRHPASADVIEALLFGDLLWCAVFKFFVMDRHSLRPRWTLGAHFSFWITMALASARVSFLILSRRQKK